MCFAIFRLDIFCSKQTFWYILKCKINRGIKMSRKRLNARCLILSKVFQRALLMNNVKFSKVTYFRDFINRVSQGPYNSAQLNNFLKNWDSIY